METTSTCRSIYSEAQCTAALATMIIVSVLSIIGSVFLIFVIVLLRKHKRLQYRIIMYISICSFLNSFTILLNAHDHGETLNVWCKIKGMSLQFNIWAILLWQLCLTVNMFINTMTFQLNRSKRQLESIYHIFCWGLSAVAVIIPLIYNKYGPAITWCWISDHDWRIWAFYVEYVVIILVIFGLYAKVVFTVLTLRPRWRERPTENHRYEAYKRRVRPMMFYPLAILLVSVFPIVYRMLTFLHPDREPPFLLTLLHIISVPLWGLLFAIVYGLDPETRQDLNWATIKSTFLDRMYGDSIREMTFSESQSGKMTSSNPNSPTNKSTAVIRESVMSDISIEPSTVYPKTSVS